MRDLLVMGGGGLLILACAPTSIFPPEVVEKVDRTLRFEQVVDHPAEYQGRVVEIGGEILNSMVEGEEVQLLVRELAIQTKPVYGPVDRGGERGMFIIRYTGQVGDQDLQRGNMVIVIGPLLGAVVTKLTGVAVSRPTVRAECVHFWRTQGEPIMDYPYPKNADRFVPLIQQTYCIGRPTTILTTTGP
jgi:starvation-inducible outer membrane lipoprotein